MKDVDLGARYSDEHADDGDTRVYFSDCEGGALAIADVLRQDDFTRCPQLGGVCSPSNTCVLPP